MSIPVDVAALGEQMTSHSFCYLLTVGEDDRAHAVAVRPVLADGVLSAEAGRTSCANVANRPAVSLVFPPATLDGYSLIVDGQATATDGVVKVVPSRAVLHRPAPAPGLTGHSEAGDCGSDCLGLTHP